MLTANDDALTPLGVFADFKKLDADAAFIWVITLGKTGHPYTIKRAVWPPRLNDFRLDHSWEGQPMPRIQQRPLELSVRRWNLDVRVYFGTQHPTKATLAKAQGF